MKDCCEIGSHDCCVMVDVPENMKHHYTKGVCADKCIVPRIKQLWAEGYVPVASCCGHGKHNPCVIVEFGITTEVLKVEVEECTTKKN